MCTEDAAHRTWQSCAKTNNTCSFAVCCRDAERACRPVVSQGMSNRPWEWGRNFCDTTVFLGVFVPSSLGKNLFDTMCQLQRFSVHLKMLRLGQERPSLDSLNSAMSGNLAAHLETACERCLC